MQSYTIDLTDEQVETIREMAIKDMPPDCPRDPKGFIEWLMEHNTEAKKREKQMDRVGKMKADEIKKAVDDWEAKPKRL